MAKVIGRVIRGPNEGVREFKQRCCDAMCDIDLQDARRHNTVGRFTMIGEGMANSSHSMLWGQAWPELPADECLLIEFDCMRNRGMGSEDRCKVLPFDPKDLETARVFLCESPAPADDAATEVSAISP